MGLHAAGVSGGRGLDMVREVDPEFCGVNIRHVSPAKRTHEPVNGGSDGFIRVIFHCLLCIGVYVCVIRSQVSGC